MRSAAVLITMFLVLTPAAEAARRRPALVARPAEELSITFVSTAVVGMAGDATLDVGAISDTALRRRPQRRGSVIEREVGVLIQQRGAAPNTTATLRAQLVAPDPHCTIRIDGRVIGTAPVVIDMRARVGIVTKHRIEIEVPASAPAGTVASSINWEVTTNG